MKPGDIPIDVVVTPREAHDWVDRAGRAWSWALAEVAAPGFLGSGFRITILVEDGDAA